MPGGLRGLGQWVQELCPLSPNRLWRSNSIFILWGKQTIIKRWPGVRNFRRPKDLEAWRLRGKNENFSASCLLPFTGRIWPEWHKITHGEFLHIKGSEGSYVSWGHPRPLPGVVFEFYRSFQTFANSKRCSLEEHVFSGQYFSAQSPPSSFRWVYTGKKVQFL